MSLFPIEQPLSQLETELNKLNEELNELIGKTTFYEKTDQAQEEFQTDWNKTFVALDKFSKTYVDDIDAWAITLNYCGTNTCDIIITFIHTILKSDKPNCEWALLTCLTILKGLMLDMTKKKTKQRIPADFIKYELGPFLGPDLIKVKE